MNDLDALAELASRTPFFGLLQSGIRSVAITVPVGLRNNSKSNAKPSARRAELKGSIESETL